MLVAVALLALLISHVSVTISVPLFKLADAINWLMVHSVDPFSEFGLASIRLPEYSGSAAIVYAIYYLPLLLLAIALAHWRPLAARSERRSQIARAAFCQLSIAQLLLLAVVILHPFSAGHADGRLRVDFLDVGQGDSALVTMPDGTTLLVDGGGRPSFLGNADATRRIGETVVSEYLWWRGLSEVDYVLATHADADHIDGLNDVLKNFHVRGALVARRPAETPSSRSSQKHYLRRKHHVETIQAGDIDPFRIAWRSVSYGRLPQATISATTTLSCCE